jgi:hypothetical protein
LKSLEVIQTIAENVSPSDFIFDFLLRILLRVVPRPFYKRHGCVCAFAFRVLRFKTNLGSMGEPGQILGEKAKMQRELGLGACGVETETDKENFLFDLQNVSFI